MLGGGGGSVTIGLCMSLYLWAVMLRDGRYVTDVVVLVITSRWERAPRLAYVSGDTRGTVSLSRGFEELKCNYNIRGVKLPKL